MRIRYGAGRTAVQNRTPRDRKTQQPVHSRTPADPRRTKKLLRWAALLDGEIIAGAIACPAPGYSLSDRSITVAIADGWPGGFSVRSRIVSRDVARAHVAALLSEAGSQQFALFPEVP